MTFNQKTSIDTINVLIDLLDSLSDEWKTPKYFILGQSTDGCSDSSNFFSNNPAGEEIFCVEAKSEEQSRILLHIQMAIVEGYDRDSTRAKTVNDSIRWSLNYYYSEQTMKEVKKFIMNEDSYYEIIMANQDKKFFIDIKAYYVPDWIEKFYTENSKDSLNSYEIEIDLNKSHAQRWNTKNIKGQLNRLKKSF